MLYKEARRFRHGLRHESLVIVIYVDMKGAINPSFHKKKKKE